MRALVRSAVLGAVLISFHPTAFAGRLYVDQMFGVTRTADIVFASSSLDGGGSIDLLCDVYQPKDIGQGAVPALSPAVVMQHGGAWTSGSKDQSVVKDFARHLARHGFVVVAANYRLYDDNPKDPSGTGPWSGITFPFYLSIYPGLKVIRAGIQDFQKAMNWTRNNAAAYGIDPDRIGAAGGSAGGINGLFVAYNNTSDKARPKAVLALVSTMYGNHFMIGGGEPPCFLLNSVSDSIIPYHPDIPDMVARMNSVGVYVEPWIQDLGQGVHDVDWNYDLEGKTVLERAKDFFAYRLAGAVDSSGRGVGDFDNSGCTDIADFLFLLDNWQVESPIGPPAIGINDFLALLDNWQAGPSC